MYMYMYLQAYMFYLRTFIEYTIIPPGVFMRDITLCNEGTPKKLKNGLYNFSKLRTLVMMVSGTTDTEYL